jgi:hypothetical protein
MKMKVLKTGIMVSDNIVGIGGMITHLVINIGGNKEYIFQPTGLHPDTKDPVEKIWLQEERISGGVFEEIEVPMEIMGTKGTDIATGFTGKIIGFIYHLGGCLHVEIKPEGVSKKTGNSYPAHEFDIRRVTGPAIKEMSVTELDTDKVKNPSPESKGKRRH